MDYDSSLIDLHIHTTASDGTCSPAQILEQAEKKRLGAISITDHDSLAGVIEALETGIPPTLKFITGVEISTRPPSGCPASGSLHILGYGVPVDDPQLSATLLQLQQARKNRNPEIIARLNEIGVSIAMDEVQREVGNGQLGRPHIARTLVAKGVVASIDEAFDRYLGKGRAAYVDKYRVPAETAVELIRDSGGIAVLAHPGLLSHCSLRDIEKLVVELKSAGLRGLEVYYPSHTPAETAAYEALARRYDLVVTGGSDFHGEAYGDIEMGRGNGSLNIPMAVYEALRQALADGDDTGLADGGA